MQFVSQPSECHWIDDCGETHVIHQGESEQGDAVSIFVCLVGRHVRPIQMQGCGRVTGLLMSKAPAFWASLWVTSILYKSPPRRSTEPSSNGCSQCRICTARGSPFFCANSRAVYSLRGLPPAQVVEFAATHDEACWTLTDAIWPASLSVSHER